MISSAFGPGLSRRDTSKSIAGNSKQRAWKCRSLDQRRRRIGSTERRFDLSAYPGDGLETNLNAGLFTEIVSCRLVSDEARAEY